MCETGSREMRVPTRVRTAPSATVGSEARRAFKSAEPKLLSTKTTFSGAGGIGKNAASSNDADKASEDLNLNWSAVGT